MGAQLRGALRRCFCRGAAMQAGCILLGAAAQGFPSAKTVSATPHSAEWKPREDEQRVGYKGPVSKRGRFRT